MHPGIDATRGEELAVGACRDDLAPVDDDDDVGRLGRREPVGDGDRGPAAGQAVGFGMDNDLVELRLELEQKKGDRK